MSDRLDRLAALLDRQTPERREAFHDWMEDEMTDTKRAPETLSQTIAAAIHDKGVSAYALGKASGVSPAIISRFLGGTRSLSLKTAERLSQTLGLVLVPKAGRGE
jgi:ribosome-binding protein aMBF1 (putative translation factor)